MRLLVLLLCWLLRRRLDGAGALAPDPLWRRLLRRAPAGDSQQRRRVPVLVGAAYLALLVLVALAAMLMQQHLGSPLAGLLALGLFVVTTGMPGWRDPLAAYGEAWQKGDFSAAWQQVRHLLPSQERGQAPAPQTLHLLVAETFIVQTFERYFMPLFWLVLVGPVGVVLTTVALGLRNHYPGLQVRQMFDRWCRVLGWLPAQLLSLTFGLAGDLGGWLHCRRAQGLERRHYGLPSAASCALSSYALDPAAFESHHPEDWSDFARRSLQAVRDLLNRSMWVWICLVALASLMGLIP